MVPAGEAGEGGVCWGAPAWLLPVPSPAGHMLQSPGLGGGRVLLVPWGAVSVSLVWCARAPDGTGAGAVVSKHRELVGSCLWLCQARALTLCEG